MENQNPLWSVDSLSYKLFDSGGFEFPILHISISDDLSLKEVTLTVLLFFWVIECCHQMQNQLGGEWVSSVQNVGKEER